MTRGIDLLFVYDTLKCVRPCYQSLPFTSATVPAFHLFPSWLLSNLPITFSIALQYFLGMKWYSISHFKQPLNWGAGRPYYQSMTRQHTGDKGEAEGQECESEHDRTEGCYWQCNALGFSYIYNPPLSPSLTISQTPLSPSLPSYRSSWHCNFLQLLPQFMLLWQTFKGETFLMERCWASSKLQQETYY